MKTPSCLAISATLSTLLLACGTGTGTKTPTEPDCRDGIIIVDQDTTRHCIPIVSLVANGIIIVDQDTMAHNEPGMFLIAPDGRFLASTMRNAGEGVVTQPLPPGGNGAMLIPGFESVTLGYNGDYVPVKLKIGSDTFTMLLSKAAISGAYRKVTSPGR